MNERTKPNTARFARNNREIARALGIKPTRINLADIGLWRMEFPDFPRKSGKGWAVAELVAWVDAHKTDFQRRKARARLLSADEKENTRDLTILQQSGDAANAPGTAAAVVESYPEVIEGVTRLAALIAARFKISCSKQQILEWKKKSPPFPAPIGANYRYRVSECFAWVERWIAAHNDGGQVGLFPKLESARIQNELESIEHEREMRAVERGQYILRADARRTIVGAMRMQMAMFISRTERDLPLAARLKLEQLGVAPPAVAEFYEWLVCEQQKVTDSIEQRHADEVQKLNV